MIEIRWAFGVFSLFLALSLAVVLPSGCASKSSPSGPSGGGGATETGIVWEYGQISNGTYSGPGAFIDLRFNAEPVTDATVVLSGAFPESPVTLGYETMDPEQGKNWALYATHAFTYVAGGVCTLTSMASTATASTAITLPGGAVFQEDGSNVVTLVSADHPGQGDGLFVLNAEGSATVTYLGGDFPVTLVDPATYPGTSGTAFVLDANFQNSTTLLSGGTMPYNPLTAEEDDYQPVTLP